MSNTRLISDLQNCNDVLKTVAVGEPLFLAKDGRVRYAVIDIADYEKTQATIKVISQLALGEKSGREKGWLTIDDVDNSLGI